MKKFKGNKQSGNNQPSKLNSNNFMSEYQSANSSLNRGIYLPSVSREVIDETELSYRSGASVSYSIQLLQPMFSF